MLGSFSEVQMAAASLASQVFFIYSVLTYGFSIAGAVLISQYWGKKDMDSIRAVYSLALRCNLVFGALVTVLVLAFPGAIMRAYSGDAEVVAAGARFLRIAAFSYLPWAASSTMYQCYKAVEAARIVAVSNAVTYGLNIAFCYVFIFGKLGFAPMALQGAALGAVLARGVELCIMLCFMAFGDKTIRYKLRHLFKKNGGDGVEPALLRRDFFKVLRPMMGHEAVWSFGMSASQAVMGQISTGAIAAFNVCYVLFELAIAPQNGLSSAAITIIGKTVGAGRRHEVKRQAYTLMLLATGLGISGALLLILGGGAFAGLFALSAEAAGHVQAIMLIMAGVVFFSAWEVVGLVGVLRGGGDAKTGFYTDLAVMWCISIPLGLLGAFAFKLSPVWVILLLKLDMPLKGTVALVRVLRMRWVTDMTRPAPVPS
jgi:putative MATE family efflux protein